MALVVASRTPRHRREHPWRTAVALLVAVASMTVATVGTVAALKRSLDRFGQSLDLGFGRVAALFTLQPVGKQVPVTVWTSGPSRPGAPVPVSATGFGAGDDVVVAICASPSIERAGGCLASDLNAFEPTRADAAGVVSVTLTEPTTSAAASCRVAGNCVIVVATPLAPAHQRTYAAWGIAPFQTAG